MLVWLSVWGEVQICICPSRCHCHSLSLAQVNTDWFYLSGTGSPGKSRTKSRRVVKQLCVSPRHIPVKWHQKHNSDAHD